VRRVGPWSEDRMYPENALEQALQDAVARYEALDRVSHTLTEQDNLKVILQTIVDITATVLKANQVTIHRFDLTQNKVELFVRGGISGTDDEFTPYPPIESAGEKPDFPPPWYQNTEKFESDHNLEQLFWIGDRNEPVPWTVITAPIIFCEHIFGFLKASNPAKHEPFTNKDENFLITLANIAALAVENERLKRSERQQRRQAETLREVAQILNYTLDQQQVLELILDQIARVVEYDTASIMLLNGDKVIRVVLRNFNDVDKIHIPEKIQTYPHMLEVLERRRPIIIDDTLQDSRLQPFGEGKSIRCWLGVPLIGRDQVIGLLNLNKEQPGYYSQQDASLAVTFANQAAVAIENARLYTSERYRVEQMDALRATIVEISTELELPRLLQAILQRAVTLVNATGGDLGLYDEIRDEIEIASSHNMGMDYTGMRLKVGEDAMGMAVLNRRPVTIEDYHRFEKASPQYRDGTWHTVLAIPFFIGHRIGGAFGIVDQNATRRFTASDQHLISHFAQQAAIAVENARLYQAAREAAERRATLHQVSQAIVAASLKPEEIYSAIHNAAARLMPLDTFVIIKNENDTQKPKPIYFVGSAGNEPPQMPFGIDGLSKQILSTGQSLYLPNTAESSLRSDFMSHVDPMPINSVLAVPMRLRGKVVGMLAVEACTADAYTTEDLYLLEMLASYAAIALDNATLFQSVQTLAITDPLTGVHNRRHLFELGQHEFQRAKRFKRPLSVLMVDIDRFKRINDQFGHAAGDAVLLRLSSLLKTSVREFDIVGRYGGEEFVIILPETSPSATYEVAERLRLLISKHFENIDIPLITVSIGAASSLPETADLDSLIHFADIAMYTAKKSGGNRVATSWNNQQ
jgi:diguanylate cyclase (GGDEF)-like protein